MKDKKGFVLLETAIVLVVVVVAMLGLYSTYTFVFKSLNQSKKYDDINDVYKLNVFYNLMQDTGFPSDTSVGSTGWIKITSSSCNVYFNDSNCSNLMNDLGFSYFIYTGKDIDVVLLNKSGLLNTDINYLKNLDYNFKYLIGVYISDNEYYYVSLKAGETIS